MILTGNGELGLTGRRTMNDIASLDDDDKSRKEYNPAMRLCESADHKKRNRLTYIAIAR